MNLHSPEALSSSPWPAGRRRASGFAVPGCERATDIEFIELLDRFRDSGGLANLAEVEAMAAVRRRTGSLGEAIAAHGVLAFGWQHTTWLPLFQFAAADLSVRPALAAVLAELSPVFDRVTLARWFVQSNCSLGGRCPVQVVEVDAMAVIDAARIDRFVAAG